jgi:hypothetical protein
MTLAYYYKIFPFSFFPLVNSREIRSLAYQYRTNMVQLQCCIVALSNRVDINGTEVRQSRTSTNKQIHFPSNKKRKPIFWWQIKNYLNIKAFWTN